MAKSIVELVEVGSVGAPYGVRGWVKINSFTEPSSNIFNYQLFLEIRKDDWQQIKIEEKRPHGSGFVAKLENIADRDQAGLITNAKLAVQRADLPQLQEDEHYWADIIGLEVYNQDDILLGTVQDFFATGANDVIGVGSGDKVYLIPYVPEMYVLEVDLEAGRLRVQWDAE